MESAHSLISFSSLSLLSLKYQVSTIETKMFFSFVLLKIVQKFDQERGSLQRCSQIQDERILSYLKWNHFVLWIHSYLCMWMPENRLEGNKTLIRWGKVLNKEADLGEPTFVRDHVFLGCTQRQCKISKDIVENYRSCVFLHGLVILEGHAKKCVEWFCELARRTIQYLYKVSTPCIDDHHFKEERLENSPKYHLKLFWNVCGSYWKTWYSMGSEQICTIDHKMDQSLWQTMILFDLTHSSHMCIQAALFLGNTEKQWRLGLFQDSDFAGDPDDSKPMEEHCALLEVIHLFQWVGCARNSFQFHTVQQNPKSPLWMQDRGWMVSTLLTCGILLFWSLQTQLRTMIERRDPLFALKQFTNVSNLDEWSIIWIMLILFPQSSNLHIRKFCLRVWRQLSCNQHEF